MASKHRITVTREMGDPDLGAEETVEITFEFRPGSPAIMYGDNAQPADPDEIEFISAKPEFADDTDWYGEQYAKARNEWAQDWIEGGDHDDEIYHEIEYADAVASEDAAEARAESRREDR